MSASRGFSETPRHRGTYSSTSSLSNGIHDDWNILSCDSVERNRSKQVAAKRAKSFTLAYEQSGQNFGRRPSASSGLRQRSSTSGHLYVKAMNYSHGFHFQRQLYENPADQARILSTGNEYSTGQQRLPTWQDVSQQAHAYSENNKTANFNQFPNKLSYSDLSQDSAYHSRHNSSVVDMGGDPGTAGLYSFPGAKMHVHGRFPSWPEADKLQTYPASTDCATHLDEVVSPRSTRRIFEEATARNSRSVRLNNRPPVTPSQNYPNFQQEFRNLDSVESSRYDATPVQPQRTKSFNDSRAQPTGFSSMTQYKSSNDISQPGGTSFISSNSGIAMTCRPFYNASAPADPSRRETEGGGRSPRVGQEWPDVEGGNDQRAVKFLSKSEGGRAVDREWATTKHHPKDFGYTVDDKFLNVVQEASPPEMGCSVDDRLNRNIGSARQPDGEVVGQSKGYPLNQSSMIRQLSKELYGQAGKRGVGLTSRMIISGERQQRLGSIDENTQSNEGSGYDSRLAQKTRRKSSTDADRSSKGSLYGMDSGDVTWRDSSLSPGVLGGVPNKLSDENENPVYVVEEDLGDGSGFVRNRKCQLSLRKAFGIFDEFEIMESSSRNVPRQASKSFRNVDDLKHQRDYETRLGSKSSLASSDALRNHNPQSDNQMWQRSSPEDRVLHQSSEAHVSPQSSNSPRLQQNYLEDISFRSSTGDHSSPYDHDSQKPLSDGSFETGWQRSPVDVDASQGQPIATRSFPESDISRAIARKKSESLPWQKTPLQLSDYADRRLSSHDLGTSVLYTGTGVLSVNLSQRSENLQQTTEVHSASDVRELDRMKPSIRSSSSVIYQNSPSSTRAMSPLPMLDSSSPSSGPRNVTSPAPPELPPRQYRKPDIAGEDPVAVKEGAELFSSNDSDVDSTLKRDTYAQQLRQESRRLSHSHSSSHTLRRQPTLQHSNWKVPADSDSFNLQKEGRFEAEVGVAPLSERLTHSHSVQNHLPLDGKIGESCELEETVESANVEPASSGQRVESSRRRVRNLASKFSSGAALEKSYASAQPIPMPTEVDKRLSSPVMSTSPTSRSSRSSNQFQQESEGGGNFTSNHHLKLSAEATCLPTSTPYSISSETLDMDVRKRSGSVSQTLGSTHSSSDGTESEAKPRHRPKVGIHKASKNKEKIDTAIVLPSVRSIESASEKDTTPPPVSEKSKKGARATSGKVAKVKCLPRQWKSTEESAYECPTSVDIHQLPDDEKHPSETSPRSHPSTSSSVRRSRHKQKHLSKASTYDDPASIIAQRLPEDERKPLAEESTYECPASVAVQQLPIDERCNLSKEPAYDRAASVIVQHPPDNEKNLPLPSARSQPTSVIIQRLPDPMEASSNYDRPTPTVILRHPKDYKRSSGRFSSPQHKTAADYMTGLFTEEDDNSSVQSDTLTRNSVQRASLRNRLLVARQAKENKERVNSSILPEEVQSLSDELRETPRDVKSSGDDVKATSEEEKLELVRVLEKKLEILKEEKQLLNEEITENKIFGQQVTAIVEQRLESKELSKYRSYVDELEKVLYLVLKLSDRLAKAENAILALPQNASDKEKAALVSKRNDLIEKHDDALSLKEGIDRRRHQVAGYLQKCLSEAELKDYEYFIKMKAQLVIDQQDVEDKIEMGQRQLDLLRSTLNSDFDSMSGCYFGPKSYC